MDVFMGTISDMISGAWNWITGQSSSSFSFQSPNDGSSGSSNDGSSPIFSYVLIGAAVLLIVAIIFGELEEV